MSIFQSDLILYSALKVALADLRRNKFLMTQAYQQVIDDPFLKDQYGLKEAERLQKFLDQEISVYMAHKQSIGDAKFPCFVIKMGSANEDSGKESLGDYLQERKVDSATLEGAYNESKILAENLNAESYDPLTGQIVLPPSVNLDTIGVYDGHYIWDTKNNKKYLISLVIGPQTILIDEPTAAINLTNFKIVTGDINMAHGEKTIWYWENHSIEAWSSNATECIYLWTILMYILSRYKGPLFDSRGFAISSYNYGPIEPYNPEDPNVLYYREVSIRGRVSHKFIEYTKPLVTGVDMSLGIEGATNPPSLTDLLDKQGWKDCRDTDEKE